MIKLKNLLESIRSPYPPANRMDKKRGFIGTIYNGKVIAYSEMVPNVMEIDHSEFPNGRNGDRWRYFVEFPRHTVLWNDFPQSDENISILV